MRVSVEGSDHDDSKDSDFRDSQSKGYEKSENLSMDKMDDLEHKSLEDIDLESNTQIRMTLGHDNIDHKASEELLVVNKMAKVFKQGRLWMRTGMVR